MLDLQGPYGFEILKADDALELAQRLGSTELRTWNEIFASDKANNHPNQVERFSKEAKKRLRELKRDDFDELHSIRLSGKGRLYGVLREGVFYIIWWDRDHQVYPSKKKNT